MDFGVGVGRHLGETMKIKEKEAVQTALSEIQKGRFTAYFVNSRVTKTCKGWDELVLSEGGVESGRKKVETPRFFK